MTGRKIKIALCLSGEPRSSMFCFPYIYENFINLNSKIFEVDVYSYSFKSFRALSLYNCKNYFIDNRNSSDLFKDWIQPLDKKLSPKSLELLLNTSNSFMNNQNGIRNLFLMYTNIQNCFNLISSKYDVYIRARYDLMFEYPIQIEGLCSKIIEGKTDLILPELDPINKSNVGICDWYAIGNYAGISYYSNLKNSLLDLINQTTSFHPEILLSKYIKNNFNLKVEKIHLRIPLVRKSFVHSDPPHNFLDQ